jgi:hypothetical protein
MIFFHKVYTLFSTRICKLLKETSNFLKTKIKKILFIVILYIYIFLFRFALLDFSDKYNFLGVVFSAGVA